MANVNFKFDNRDVVVVTGAEGPTEAVTAAENFLRDISLEDATTDYGMDAQAEYMEISENGRYEFRVIIADK